MNKLKKNNSSFLSINVLIIIFLSVISFFYFIIVRNYMPEKFKFDSGIIKENMLNLPTINMSYKSTANFFKFLGMSFNTPMVVIHIFSWIVFVFILLTILRINNTKPFKIYQIMFILFFTIFYGFYFTNYSKDIIVLIFFIVASNLPHINNDLLINIVLSIFIYGFFFRRYWIIIGIISLILLFIKRVKIKRDILYILIAILVIILIFNLIKHNQITNMRVYVNQNRVFSGDTNDKSMINNLVLNSSVVTDVINYFYNLITLFIPLQGISSFNMIVYYLWIISISYFSIRNWDNINPRLLLLLFIFINIQALFEPDIGSVFRHQLSWFIIIYYALLYKKNNNIKIGE